MVATIDEYARFVGAIPYPDTWHLFGTITNDHERFGGRSSRSWRKSLDNMFQGKHKSLPTACIPAKYFWALERHKSGRFHCHYLLNYQFRKDDGFVSEKLDRRRYDLWSHTLENFGRSQVLKYEPGKGAIHYVTKYCFKEGLNRGFEWDFRT